MALPDSSSSYTFRVKDSVFGAQMLFVAFGALVLVPLLTGLDPNVARDLRAIVVNLTKQGMTVFLTTHYMEEADQLCDRVAIINQGRIVALDTPKALKTRYGKDERTSLEDVFVHLTGRYLGRGSE